MCSRVWDKRQYHSPLGMASNNMQPLHFLGSLYLNDTHKIHTLGPPHIAQHHAYSPCFEEYHRTMVLVLRTSRHLGHVVMITQSSAGLSPSTRKYCGVFSLSRVGCRLRQPVFLVASSIRFPTLPPGFLILLTGVYVSSTVLVMPVDSVQTLGQCCMSRV